MHQQLRQAFPSLSQLDHDHQVYLDSAATTQKPQVVLDSYQSIYGNSIANVHRSGHRLGRLTTEKFEQSRNTMAEFIGSKQSDSIVFTKGTTESVNLLVNSWAKYSLKKGDEIILSLAEHHANLVPWQRLAQQLNLTLKWIKLTSQGHLDLNHATSLFTSKTALLAITHVSNVLGAINPIKQLIELAKKHNAVSFIDGAQAIPHLSIDVLDLDCDFYAFSGHKMYAPSGTGVLYVHPSRFDEMHPWQFGGEMVRSVGYDQTHFQVMPLLLEAGTPNIEAIIALGAATRWLMTLDRDQVFKDEQTLFQTLLAECKNIEDIHIISAQQNNVPILSFNIGHLHPFDVASLLDEQGVAIRAGYHCAQPLLESMNCTGCMRVSLGMYNHSKDIQIFMGALNHAIQILSDAS